MPSLRTASRSRSRLRWPPSREGTSLRSNDSQFQLPTHLSTEDLMTGPAPFQPVKGSSFAREITTNGQKKVWTTSVTGIQVQKETVPEIGIKFSRYLELEKVNTMTTTKLIHLIPPTCIKGINDHHSPDFASNFMVDLIPDIEDLIPFR